MKKPYISIILPKRRFPFRAKDIGSIALIAVFLAAGVLLLRHGRPAFTAASLTKQEAYENQPSVVIVIDDFGQDRKGVKDMLSLPVEITVAVMPFMEYTQADAEAAKEAGKEIIVHMPMQARADSPQSWYNTEYIRLTYNRRQAYDLAKKAAASVPYAIGMNIHTGSGCSENYEIARGVMDACEELDFYFIDSLTSSKSVCAEAASDAGVHFAKRAVFLEHGEKTKDHIKKQLALSIDIAKEKGSCVCIGHVGPEGGDVTVQAIKEMLTVFEAEGVAIVPASRLFQ